MKIFTLDSPYSNPLYNLALEEYLFRFKTSENYVLTYVNSPSVIIGKHQNAFAEINYLFTRRHQIPVLRRLSGGGTVYHDNGNMNFTFIKNISELKIDFQPFLRPVCDVLNDMGLHAVIGKNNDILIDGFKISGNAQHIFKRRLIHHGTLLFAGNLTFLNEAIAGREKLFEGNAVASKRSMVTNISDLIQNNMDFGQFKTHFIKGLQKRFKGMSTYELTPTDHEAVEHLVRDKYTTWEWNFGYGPDYDFINNVRLPHLGIHTSLSVKKGFIVKAAFCITDSNENKIDRQTAICTALTGKKHREADIFSVLKKYHTSLHYTKLTSEELCLLFF